MKNTFSLLLFAAFLSFSNSTLAETYQRTFVGSIQLIDKSIITYKLKFNENVDGTIEGISITDFSGSHMTETKIRGRLDAKKKTISFSEVENVATKSDSNAEDFCYLHVYNAKIKLKKNKSIIQGHFYSRYLDGSLCIEGDVYLVGEEQLIRNLDKSGKKAKLFLKKEKSDKIIEKLEVTKEKMSNSVLKENDKLNITVKSDQLVIKLWDAEQEDGDRISIYKDDELILMSYKVTKDPKIITIPIDKDSISIKMLAMNEGRIPPNSASIEISSEDISMPLKLKLNKGKEAELLLLQAK